MNKYFYGSIILISGYFIFKNIDYIVTIGIIGLIIFGIYKYYNSKNNGKKEMSKQEYEPNDDFIPLYEKMGLFEDYEKGSKQPVLKDIEEYDRITTFSFWSNNNKVSTFVKNKEIIEEFFNANILEITRNQEDKRIINLSVISEPLESFYKWGGRIVPRTQGDILIGKSIKGDVIASFNKIPHFLIAGETGGGKTVAIKNIIMQLIHQTISSYSIEIKIADFKGAIDYSIFFDTLEVIEKKKRLAEYTSDLNVIMDKRIELLKSKKVENVDGYNKISSEKIHRIILVVDELVECLSKEGLDKKDDIEEINLINTINKNLTRLARLSRAVNINMVLGTQLPTSSCLGNQLKNNIVGRICGRFADESASRVVISTTEAKNLPDVKGRMLYKSGADILQVQIPFIDNNFIEYYIKDNQEKIDLINLPRDEISDVRKEKKEKEQEKSVSFAELQKQKKNKKTV